MVHIVYSTHWHLTGNTTGECVIVDPVAFCDELKPEDLVDVRPSRMHVILILLHRPIFLHEGCPCCGTNSTKY